MSELLKFELKGAAEAEEALKNLSKKDLSKIYYALNRKGGNVVKKYLQNAAPSKRAKKNVLVVKGKNPTEVLVGFSKKVFFISFLEFGTEVRTTRGKGKRIKKQANRGNIEPTPFVQAAHDRAGEELQKRLGENYQEELNKTIKSEVIKINNRIKKLSK